MVAKESTFVDSVTIVPAAWFNLIQEFLAGYVNLSLSWQSSTQVQVVAGSSDDVASIYSDGEMRRRDTSVSVTISGGAGTYFILATVDSADNLFALESVHSLGTPAATDYRKIGEVEWDGAAITVVRNIAGRVEAHSHDDMGTPRIDHSDLEGTADDDHPQIILADGSRAFTGTVAGVTPESSAHLATKAYSDAALAPFPVASLAWWPTDTPPAGYLICDGSEISRTTYAALFGIIGETYGAGDGFSTFRLPDFRQRIPLGLADTGTGSALGETGGAIVHTHTQPTHTHPGLAHTHAITDHTHTNPSTASGGSHSHTQGNNTSGNSHTHTGPSHTHGAGTLDLPSSGGASVGSRNGSSTTAGLFPESELDGTPTDSSSHTHGPGSYIELDGQGDPIFVTGSSSSSSISGHTHPPSGNSYAHTHAIGAPTGSTASGGTGATGSGGSHSHTNPNTNSGGSHTHTIADTGLGGMVVTDSDAASPASEGGEVTGSAIVPFLALNVMIRV